MVTEHLWEIETRDLPKFILTDNVWSLGTLSACRSFETKDYNGDISESVGRA